MPHLDPDARSLLSEARQLYVGVVTKNGPHVTPELYAVTGDDIWFATAATTLKARAVRADGRLAAAVRVGTRAVAVTGTAQLYDAADPRHLAGLARGAHSTLQALGAFTLRNAADLGGFARDLVTGRLPSRVPPRRVLVRLRPSSAAVVDLGGLPGSRDAVIGWSIDGAPVVVPGRADADAGTAWVPASMPAEITPADGHVAACVAFDDYRAPGPAAKQGVLRRGSATVSAADGAVRLDVDAASETTWAGARTQTRPAS